MKKLFMLAGVLCFGAITFAQTSVEKKLRIGQDVSNSISASPATNEKAARHFAKQYPDVLDGTWTQLPENKSACFFSEDGLRAVAYYDAKGNWLYTLTDRLPEVLTADTRNQINGMYGDFEITDVKEITLPYQSPIYVVAIQTARRVLTLRVSGDEIDTLKELKKG